MRKKRQTLLSMLLGFIAISLIACGGRETTPVTDVSLEEQTQTIRIGDAGSYTNVSARGLAALMEEQQFPLINVHIPYEGELEGTDLFIPYDEIAQNLDQLPSDKEARIVLYCRSGSMSAQAAQTLVELGYTDVWNLDGGMIAWENSGRPLLYR